MYFRTMNQMRVADGLYVEVSYKLREDGPEGEELELYTAEDPFAFVVGADEVLPAFEQAMMGKEVGDTFEISLSVEDAYGEEDEEAFVELPKSAFMVDGEIDESLFEVGEVVPMETEDGDEVIGIIDEVRLNSVVVDFNHPYAGMNLHFVGKVTLIEKAPPQAN
jgi:FKBP-type peptidyl-prolyl cis-trans isomerase SlyD